VNMAALMNQFLLTSQLLDLHLTRSIDRFKMSRHNDIAQRMRKLKEAQEARLAALDQRMDKHETESDAVFRSYEGFLEENEAAMKEMEDSIKAMKGNGEEAEGNVASFPGGQSKALGTG